MRPLCDECEERPAVKRYRYGDVDCVLCDQCAERIRRTSSVSLVPCGPAAEIEILTACG